LARIFLNFKLMNQAILIFPDSSSIADFLLENSISNAEVNTLEQKVTAPLSDVDILIACTDYKAVHLNQFFFNDELENWRKRRIE
jgi:hypothetical protein